MGLILVSGAKGGTPAPNVPSPASDTLAPAIPQRAGATLAVGQITWTVDQSADMHDGVTAASGLPASAAYDLSLNGGAPIAINRIAANIMAQPTLVHIGSASPTGTAVQTGLDWVLSAAGTGLDSVGSDQFEFLYWSVTGDFSITVECFSASGASANPYGRYGVMARDSVAVGSRFASLGQWFSAQSRGIDAQGRTVLNAAYDQHAFVDGNNTPRKVNITRIGTALTWNYMDASGVWQVLMTQLSNLASTVLIGGFGASYSASNTMVATLMGLHYSNGARVSHMQTTTDTNQTARWRARDVDGNVSSYGETITRSPLVDAPPPTDYIKWHPGVGKLYGGYIPPSLADPYWNDAIYPAIDDLLDKPEIKFFHATVYWPGVETTFGVYYFDHIHAMLTRCEQVGAARAVPLRLSLEIWSRQFAVSQPAGPSNWGPAYIFNEATYGQGGGIVSYYYTEFGFYTWFAALWRPAVMDRLIAMYQALSDEFDGEEFFEMIHTEETTLLPWPDYDEQDFYDQLERMITEMATVFPHTYKFLNLNYLGSISTVNGYAMAVRVNDIMAHLAATPGWGFAGTDIKVTDPTDGDRVFIGQGIVNRGGTLWNMGDIDYRSVMPSAVHVEFVQQQSTTSAQMEDYSYNVLRQAYFPAGETYALGAYQNWDASPNGMYAVIEATGGRVHSACPTNLGGICSSS